LEWAKKCGPCRETGPADLDTFSNLLVDVFGLSS
jgi:hypothetical protein